MFPKIPYFHFYYKVTYKESEMGKKGKDRFDDIRKPRGAKKPVRKYTDQRMGHVRGYKDVDCSETSL